MLKRTIGHERSKSERSWVYGVILAMTLLSIHNYTMIPAAIVSLIWLSRGHSKESNIISEETWFGVLLALLFFALIYPESRFTIIAFPILLGLLKLIENRMFVEEKNRTPKRLLIPFVLILITAYFLL